MWKIEGTSFQGIFSNLQHVANGKLFVEADLVGSLIGAS
jgi:hypothetical protein